MKQFFKKLFGYKYVTYVFDGDMFGEMTVHSALTRSIDDDKLVMNPDKYFRSSVIVWETEPKQVLYHKTLPRKMFNDHFLLEKKQ